MKNLSLLFAAVFSTTIATAQFYYDFSTRQEAYIPLVGALSINDTSTWDDRNIKVPLGFDFSFNGKLINTFNMSGFQLLGEDTVDIENSNSFIFSGFLFMNTDLHDRADTGSTPMKSASPLRYVTIGQTPDRIFKFEMFNAGFYHEYYTYGTSNDSINLQIWMYEQGAIEFHFGSSEITYLSEYFNGINGFLFAYMDSLNASDGSFKMLYYLSGSTSNPIMDSTDDINMFGNLSDYPDSGVVFRYTPKPVGIENVVSEPRIIDIYPTIVDDKLFISNPNKKLLYKVLSIQGQLTDIEGCVLENTKATIDVSTLAAGNYIVQLLGETGMSVKKIVKK